jgi:hypothetical protein
MARPHLRHPAALFKKIYYLAVLSSCRLAALPPAVVSPLATPEGVSTIAPYSRRSFIISSCCPCTALYSVVKGPGSQISQAELAFPQHQHRPAVRIPPYLVHHDLQQVAVRANLQGCDATSFYQESHRGDQCAPQSRLFGSLTANLHAVIKEPGQNLHVSRGREFDEVITS